jgi:2-polyprenyl-6-methoxyphenol hydroxylase-like FAD-dependent oxidoreductase
LFTECPWMEVLAIGAGLTGPMLANQLAWRGIRR